MEGGRGNQQKSEWAGREHGQKYYCEKKGWPNPAGPRGVSPKERTKTMVEAGVAAQPRCKQDRGPRGLTSLCGCGPNGAPLEHVTDNIDNIPFYPPLRQNCLTLGGESRGEQNRNDVFPRARAPRRSQGGSDIKAPVRPGHYDYSKSAAQYGSGVGPRGPGAGPCFFFLRGRDPVRRLRGRGRESSSPSGMAKKSSRSLDSCRAAGSSAAEM